MDEPGPLTTAIVGTVHFSIAFGCFWAAKWLTERVPSRIGRAAATWPLYAIGFIFGSSAVLIMFMNMFGPLIGLLFGIFRYLRAST